MTTTSTSRKTLDRLLQRTLPDEKQIIKVKRAKKSRNLRSNKARLTKDKLAVQAMIDVEYKTNQKNITRTSNLKALRSWNNSSEQVKGLQERIIRNQKLTTGPKSTITRNTKQKTWPGLTPGLAPVGYETSDEEDHDD